MACILVRGQILFYFRVKFITSGVKFIKSVVKFITSGVKYFIGWGQIYYTGDQILD